MLLDRHAHDKPTEYRQRNGASVGFVPSQPLSAWDARMTDMPDLPMSGAG